MRHRSSGCSTLNYSIQEAHLASPALTEPPLVTTPAASRRSHGHIAPPHTECGKRSRVPQSHQRRRTNLHLGHQSYSARGRSMGDPRWITTTSEDSHSQATPDKLEDICSVNVCWMTESPWSVTMRPAVAQNTPADGAYTPATRRRFTDSGSCAGGDSFCCNSHCERGTAVVTSVASS